MSSSDTIAIAINYCEFMFTQHFIFTDNWPSYQDEICIIKKSFAIYIKQKCYIL